MTLSFLRKSKRRRKAAGHDEADVFRAFVRALERLRKAPGGAFANIGATRAKA